MTHCIFPRKYLDLSTGVVVKESTSLLNESVESKEQITSPMVTRNFVKTMTRPRLHLSKEISLKFLKKFLHETSGCFNMVWISGQMIPMNTSQCISSGWDHPYISGIIWYRLRSKPWKAGHTCPRACHISRWWLAMHIFVATVVDLVSLPLFP